MLNLIWGSSYDDHGMKKNALQAKLHARGPVQWYNGAKTLMEVGINMEGGIFRKKLVHKCNKRGVAGGKNLRNK